MDKTSPKSSQGAGKSKQVKKLLIFGGVILGLSALGGAAWYYSRKTGDQSGQDSVSPLVNSSPPPKPVANLTPTVPALPSSGSVQSGFPLKNGSRGENVKQLQTALNQKYGAKLVVDGIWGAKTQAALNAANLATVIDATTFANIVSSTSKLSAATPVIAAANLGVAVRAGNFAGALSALQNMKSASDYKAASDLYKTQYVESVRKTIVNAMVGRDARWNPTEKQQARQEFLRMGLLYDSVRDTWSLPAGLSGFQTNSGQVIAIRETVAWTDTGQMVPVPSGFLVGTLIDQTPTSATVLSPMNRIVYLPIQDLKIQ